MYISASSALWFLPFAAPICIWAACSDMKSMKIPNKAVLALIFVFAVVGLIALPLSEYPWRYVHLLVILAFGFVLNMVGAIGAGDAKFAAAMAPFVARGDSMLMIYFFAAVLLAAFATHRLFRGVPALRNLTPSWESWENEKFPMGLALGGALIFYLAAGAFYGI